MKKILLAVMIMIIMTTQVMAEVSDPMKDVFEHIDDLVTRVESGISLNSYAEDLAKMKIDFKNAKKHKYEQSFQQDNPLLNDRMKNVIKILDDYGTVWRVQEIDHYKYLQYPPSGYNVGLCSYKSDYLSGYEVSCLKRQILNEIKPILEKSKSAHFNGW